LKRSSGEDFAAVDVAAAPAAASGRLWPVWAEASVALSSTAPIATAMRDRRAAAPHRRLLPPANGLEGVRG
jgi:hypothetical protein